MTLRRNIIALIRTTRSANRPCPNNATKCGQISGTCAARASMANGEVKGTMQATISIG